MEFKNMSHQRHKDKMFKRKEMKEDTKDGSLDNF